MHRYYYYYMYIDHMHIKRDGIYVGVEAVQLSIISLAVNNNYAYIYKNLEDIKTNMAKFGCKTKLSCSRELK